MNHPADASHRDPLTTPLLSPEAPPAAPAGTASPHPPASLVPQEQWLADLAQAGQVQTSWLWHGFLAPGSVTLLTSQWKSGKTTLLSVLLARLKTGGQFLGLPLAPGKAAVVSEESPALWWDRGRKLGIGDNVCWFCRPFKGKPRPEEWLALLDRLAEVHARHGLSLVAIDPLSAFFPGRGENNADLMLEFLMTLQRLTTLGLSVLLLHHPNKKEALAGLAARGSGALSGFADILLEMKWYTHTSTEDRRRRLQAFSRFTETPRQLILELDDEGTDYLCRGNFHEEEFEQNWLLLHTALEDARTKLTRPQIAKEWPPDAEPPTEITLWRWLTRAVAQGLVLCEGSGRKSDPYRYWLPEREGNWPKPTWKEEVAKLLESLDAADPLAGLFNPPAP